MSRRLVYFFLLFLLVADLGFSFMQYYATPLDGDMAGGIVPAEEVKHVLNNPLGLETILHGKMYPNPNKFICHWSFKTYFSTVPFMLQYFVSPIESAYIACAIFKILIHLFLLVLLAVAVTGSKQIWRFDFVLAMLLITPLFQANGYRIYMGIIDPAVTYVFFYAMPCLLVLLYFLPLLLEIYHGKAVSSRFVKILWIPLGLAVCLSGPLNPGIVLVISFLMVLQNLGINFKKSEQSGFLNKIMDCVRKIPKSYWFYLLPVSLFALYSLFLGRYNSIDTVINIPLGEMFARLPAGVYYLLSQKPGMPLLLLMVCLNLLLIRLNYRNSGKKILCIARWIGIFAMLYILLLPFGGYRYYRSNILRYDTILPITLMLMFIFALSTIFIARNISRRQKYWYFPVIAGIMLIYTNADRGQLDRNACEKSSLQKIADSKDKIVQIESDCNVLSWGEISKTSDTELNAKLLKFWKITDEEKLYEHR